MDSVSSIVFGDDSKNMFCSFSGGIDSAGRV